MAVRRGRLREASILIVEDKVGDIRLFEEFFKDVGLVNPIEWIDNRDEALKYITNNRPDLVLLEPFIEAGKGLDVLGEVRSDPNVASVKVIVVSGAVSVENLMDIAPHADAYVLKPITLEDLAVAVAKIGAFGIAVVRVTE